MKFGRNSSKADSAFDEFNRDIYSFCYPQSNLIFWEN